MYIDLSKEEIEYLLNMLKDRKQSIINTIKLFNELIKDGRGSRLDLVENCELSQKHDLDLVNLITPKLERLL